jgi:glucose dehydrogenase
MYALNSTTGALLWQYSGLDEIHVTPAVANGSLYFGAYNGNFYSLNASTGALNWQVRLDGGLGETSSPAVANGVVYAGTANSPDLLYALDASTGAVLWQYATKGLVDASPTVANGNVLVGDTKGYFYRFGLSGNLSPTNTTLTSSPNPSAYGEAVELTATVTSSGSSTPTGTVTFKSGSTSLGNGTLSAGTAKLSTKKILVGTDSLTATYNGDAKNGKSTSPAIAQTVSQAAISMTLASSPNPSSSGQSVKFTATLTSTGGLPIGDVSFTFGSTTLGTASINTKGVATLSTKALPTGTDKVTASCAGDTNYSPASASVTQTVN